MYVASIASRGLSLKEVGVGDSRVEEGRGEVRCVYGGGGSGGGVVGDNRCSRELSKPPTTALTVVPKQTPVKQTSSLQIHRRQFREVWPSERIPRFQDWTSSQ